MRFFPKNEAFWKGFYILLSLIPLLIGVAGFIILLQSPYLGMKFESKSGKWLLSSVAPDGPAAKYPELIGKEIVAIGDWKVDEHTFVNYVDDIRTPEGYRQFWEVQNYFSDHINVGSPITLKLKGTDREFVRLMPGSYPWIKALSETFVSYLVAIIALLIGLVVILKKPEDTRVKVFAFMVFSMSLYIASNAAYSSRDIVFSPGLFKLLGILNSLVGIYIGVSMLHFFMVFPREKRLAGNKLFIITLYLLPILVTVIYQMRLWWSSHYIYTFACLLAGFGFLVHSFFNIRSAEEKSQVKWVLWGMGLFVILALALHVFPILMGHRLFNDSSLYVLILLPPLSIAFAILKYRLMDIDTLFDNALVYTITLGLLALLDFAIITSLSNLKILSFSVSQPLSIVVGVWMILFAYVPVRNFTKKQIRKLLKREVYDIDQVALQLSKDLLSATDIRSSFEKVMKIIQQALQPKGAEAFIFDQKGLAPVLEPRPSFLPDPSDIFKKLTKPTPVYELHNVDSFPAGYSGGVVIPIIGTKEHQGCIILQNKHSEKLYSGEDIKLLDIAASQLALHIEAIREIRKREQESFAEKERISREIHDGIGSSFIKAIMISEMIGPEAPEDTNKYHKELKKTLSEGLAELRTLVWTVDESQNTLQDLVLQIQEHIQGLKNKGTITYRFHRKVMDDDLMIPPLLRRNIIRIVNESLTNIIKYAEASEVDITFLYDGEKLILAIRDNGKGCCQSAPTKGHGLKNMKSRCEEMGGRFSFFSEPQKGTEVTLEMPLMGH